MTWIVRLLCLAILLGILYALVPEGPLRAVLCCVMGLVLLVSILRPVGNLLRDHPLTWLNSVMIEDTENLYTDGNRDAVLTEYKGKCNQAIAAYVQEKEGVSRCRVDVLIDDNWDSATFGSLQHVYLYITFGKEKENSPVWIPPIVIGPESKPDYSTAIKEIQAAVASWLQINEKCVTVFEEGSNG